MRDIFSMPSDDVSLRGRNDNVELTKAWAGTSLAYAVALSGGAVLSAFFPSLLLVAALTCGIAFVAHELAHRVVARGYGAEAHFIANNGWLLISIVLAFTGFFIAAPGAVWHRGYLTPRQSGLIALAGPAINMVIAVLCLGLLYVVPRDIVLPLNIPLSLLIAQGYTINAWIGLFNMIPAGPFDGAKVLNWDWRVFAVTVAVGIFLTFVLPRSGFGPMF